MEITCRIEAVPVAKERPRLTRYGGVYTPKKTADFEELVAQSWRDQVGTKFEDEPLEVHLNFGVVNMAQDIDNLCKTILDGLNGVAWKDDRQVHKLNAWKYHTTKPEALVNIIVRVLKTER
jgi:crossover junction endodeoxyribonuclease RusA